MKSPRYYNISASIKRKALKLGFDIVGIAKARALYEREPVLRAWLEEGMNDIMEYMAREPQRRLDPSMVLPGAKSLIVTGLSYYNENAQKKKGVPVISRYTYGKDYHDIIIPRLSQLLDFIRMRVPGVTGKIYCDTGPVHEKAWACEAGLGWQGRHSILINPVIGSFFFIGIIILDIGLEYDRHFAEDLCGDCTLCVDACPTGAINGNRTIDARKCISHLTIERRGAIPVRIIPELGKRIYGCDRCQEVCPWNRDARPCKTPEFKLPDEIAEMEPDDWLSLTEERFIKMFSGSPVGRKKFEQLKENIKIALR